MSTAARRDGRDHDTLIPGAGTVAAIAVLAALAAQFAPQNVAAQSAPCTAIADDAERLACYDRALRAAPAAPAPTAVPTPEPTPPAPATETPIAPPVQTPVAAAEAPTTSAAQAPAAKEQQRDADREIVPIVVVGVRTLRGRETTFTTQDGAWVQTDSQRVVGLPATPFDAELKRGAMGSTFLVPKNGGRAIRVRAVER
jgi:hypothetical protein